MTSTKAANTCPSRSAPKFVIRIPKELNQAINDLAERSHRSTNSEIVMAVESWLLHKPDLLKFQQLLVAQVGFDKFTEIHSRERSQRGGEINKFVVRLLPGMREAISAEKIAVKKPMNDIFLQILNWWININQDLTSLFAVYSASMGDASPASEGFNVTTLINKAA
jgi:hypothetical protein